MANPPPPYDDITGISRTVMKDNAQESITNYNGNARPGEMVVDLTNNDVYIGNTNGNLTLLSYGNGTTQAAFDPQFQDVNGTFAGNAVVTGEYYLTGHLCYFHVQVDFSGTTNYGNSQYQFRLPFPSVKTVTSTNGTLHQVGGGGGSGANTIFHIAAHIDQEHGDANIAKLYYSQAASDLAWKFNVPGGVPPGGTNAYWAVAGDAHFDINGTYLIDTVITP